MRFLTVHRGAGDGGALQWPALRQGAAAGLAASAILPATLPHPGCVLCTSALPPAHTAASLTRCRLPPYAPQVNELYKHRVTPCHDSARRREVRVDLFSSEEVNPSYVSDTMTLVETIVLPLDMTRVEHEDVYFIDLSFKFGAVEIEVGGKGARWLLACR
jgi:hypothetical protein